MNRTLVSLADLGKLLGLPSPRRLGYRRFEIPKRSGGMRPILAPTPELRRVQRVILRELLDPVPLHDAAHGFVRGRSTVTGARHHLAAALVVKFDLQDFFPTVHVGRVQGLFRSLGYPAPVAAKLAWLCTHVPRPLDQGRGRRRVLPQGAPTSPAICNLVCRRLDARLSGLARSRGGVYTRYADDLAFSFAAALSDVAAFRWSVEEVCRAEGFAVNAEKFRAMPRGRRQAITGVLVHADAPRVSREFRRRLRAALHRLRLRPMLPREHAAGMAAYVSMVEYVPIVEHSGRPRRG